MSNRFLANYIGGTGMLYSRKLEIFIFHTFIKFLLKVYNTLSQEKIVYSKKFRDEKENCPKGIGQKSPIRGYDS